MTEKDSLHERVLQNAPSSVHENPVQSKHNSIDDAVKEDKPKEKKATLGRIVKDLLYIAPIAAVCTALVGPAAFLTPVGLSIGGYLADKKAKRKTPWSVTRKRIGLGFPAATLAYWAYSIPDMIPNITFLGKIAKTLFFNPVMCAPWIFWYKTTDYVLQKYGFWKGFVGGLVTLKIFKYYKESYNEKIKGKFKDTLKETFMTLAPIHFFSMNYIKNPFYRLCIGTGNDVLFSMIAGEQGLLKTLKQKFGKKKEQKDYKPVEEKPKLNYSPNYFNNPSPYYSPG